jgi:HSP20 family protein
MTTNLTQTLRQGAEHALETMAEAWRELRLRAGGALTRFRSVDGGKQDGNGTADFPPIERWAYMAADVIEEDDDVVVRLEAPGMRREDFIVELREAVLSVRGEKRIDRESKRAGYRVVECAYGTFRRDVPLPVPVVADRVTASYRDGVLRVTLPKAEGSHLRRWSVEVK